VNIELTYPNVSVYNDLSIQLMLQPCWLVASVVSLAMPDKVI
jgi:hypothetical protein